MKYTVDIDGNEIEVDGLEYGVLSGSSEGNIDLYVRIIDEKMDIYDSDKKDVWISWINACIGEDHNPEERIKPIIVKVYGGEADTDCYRTITIKHACIASYQEMSGRDEHSYEVIIKRAPRKGDEDAVSIVAGDR